MNKENLPDIFEYFDYRKYLHDWYKAKKESNTCYTYRFISQRVDIDPGYLVKIFQGQKHFNLKKLPALAKLLKLNQKKTEYFELLVLYNKAKADTEIQHYFEKLLSYLELGKEQVEADKYEFYQKWYHTVIREIIRVTPISDNFEELAQVLLPKITASQARKSVELLERLEFIYKDDSGIYQPKNKFISTGKNLPPVVIRNFQKDMMSLAQDALGKISPSQRDISTVTISLSEEGFDLLKEKLQIFRNDLLELAGKSYNPDRVYQVNLQIFPVSKVKINNTES